MVGDGRSYGSEKKSLNPRDVYLTVLDMNSFKCLNPLGRVSVLDMNSFGQKDFIASAGFACV
jgi:hypothetical protein